VNVSLSAWLVILLALVAANLPFASERLFAVIPFGRVKPVWLRLLELVALYFLVLGIAWLLEERIGNAFPQGWEFYVITGCLFLVFAFPGFVWRHLRRRHG
jgi:hypothetical protein